jgi:emericellamide synthase (highly reducing iterative type I polyketide synthase)
MCSRLAKYLVLKHHGSRDANGVLERLAYTLGKQSAHAHRLALVSSNLDNLVDQLIMASQSPVPSRSKKGQSRIAFVFSGQGAQYAEMGRQLFKSYPSFIRSIERARQRLIELGCHWDLLSELCRPKKESRINEPAISQPLSTAIQLALVDLLFEFNISPCAVAGHSSGEIAAAYAAEIISFEDAMAVSYFRGKFTDKLITGNPESKGAMLAVGADPTAAEEHINRIDHKYGRMRIACFNSPSSVTVSGDFTAIDQLKAVLDVDGVFNRKLVTNGAAYHSHQMKPMKKEYAAALETFTNTQDIVSSSIRMFSTVTGKEIDKGTVINGDYWVKNLLNPVLFSHAIQNLCEQEYGDQRLDMIIEVGPHSQLGGPVNQILKSLGEGDQGKISYASTLKRGRDAEISLLECMSAIQVQSASLNIHELNREMKGYPPSLLVDLPPYPFDHERTFWHETRVSKDYRHRQHPSHELLGTPSPDMNRLEPRWRRLLSLKDSPWLRGHVVQGQIVFPAAGFLTMATQAVRQHMEMTNPTVRVESILFRNISICKALVLSEDGPDVDISLSLRPEARTARESSNIWNEFRIFSVTPDNKWTEHCRGLVHAETCKVDANDVISNLEDLSRIDTECPQNISHQKAYHRSRACGLDWQHPFDNISKFRTSQSACVSTVRNPITDANLGGMVDVLHPATLDSCLFHGTCMNLILEKGIGSAVVPTFIKQLRIFNQPLMSTSELVSTSTICQEALTFDVVIQDTASAGPNIIVEAQGVHLLKLPGDVTLSPVSRDLCHGVDWVTYVDAWTTEHRNRICKSVVPPASVVEQNRYLNTLTLHYAQRAVRETISANVPDGASRHFFEWMKTLAGDVSQAPVFPKEFAGHDTEPLDEAVLRLGPHLSKILTRETHPLSLLVPDNLLGRLYNSERSNRCTAQIARYCNELGKQKPGLRVLEVGAGTASATLPILQALSGSGIRSVSRYDFTDISPGFFESAKQCLGDLVDVVEFKVLDVERDPKEQGFEPASYDLIIAGNVIHATRRIDPVLANIRSLLKPGGKFVLMEVTQAEPFYNLIFGVFDGWWAGYDDGRRESPLLSQTQWISRLQLAGFSDPEPWFEDHPQTEGGTISVLIASASFDAIHEELPPIHMVTTDSDESEVWITENWIRSIKQKLPNIQISANSLSSPASDGGIALILPDVAKLLCDNVDADYWQKFKNWVLTARAVILVSYGLHKNIDDPSCGLWIGFARSLRLEHPSLRLVTLDLEASETLWLGKLAEVLPALLLNLKLDLSRQISERENEFAEKDGQLFVSRLYPRQKITDFVRRSERQVAPEIVPFLNNNRILTAELGVPGLIDSIRWKDDIEAPILGLDDVKIELHAASINFKDVLIAAGQLEGITEMRNDCSGIVTEVGTNMRERFKPGDRVCAMYSRSYTNYPVVHGDCCHVVPDDMTFEEAASLPIVWTTVYYSLIDMGRLARGEKILIHSAAGAVGQAAIMLAQHIGAEIFVTVGSNGKRDLLHEKYNIPLENIFSSRSSAFYGSIKRITGSYGVDVVLNSLGGEMFRQSCNLVAPFGRFIEIGKKDLMDDALMPMNFLLRNITFALVDLHAIIDSKKSLARRLLQEVVRLAADRLIRPVTITTMPISEIKTAFRQMQAGKHIGKIILSVQEGQEVEVRHENPR